MVTVTAAHARCGWVGSTSGPFHHVIHCFKVVRMISSAVVEGFVTIGSRCGSVGPVVEGSKRVVGGCDFFHFRMFFLEVEDVWTQSGPPS